jgi:hypothetical protein
MNARRSVDDLANLRPRNCFGCTGPARSRAGALDALDRAVPERPGGVAARAVQLLVDVDELQPFALADALDTLPLSAKQQA